MVPTALFARKETEVSGSAAWLNNCLTDTFVERRHAIIFVQYPGLL